MRCLPLIVSETSTSDKSDTEASEGEDTIDLCSDEPDAESDYDVTAWWTETSCQKILSSCQKHLL